MRSRIVLVAAVLSFALLLSVSLAQEIRQGEPGRPGYTCPPCGCPGDTLIFAAEGSCPHCGMPMVLIGSQKKVAILIYDGVEILDFTGPYEVFAADIGHFEVYTVSKTGEPVTTGLGAMTVSPHYGFENCPKADIFVVPGGGTGAVVRDDASMAYVNKAAEEAEIVLSVCSGAFILGRAGLLDGHRATAHEDDSRELERAFPKVKVVHGARYVDNGKIVTSGGVSAGIDAALHVIARLHGDARADRVARYLQHVRRKK